MKECLVNLNLMWCDSKGVCHCVCVDSFLLSPGDKVDSSVKFTFVGDDNFPDIEDPYV